MAQGDLYEATAGDSTDIYYVDTGMFDTAEYGSVYILDTPRPAVVDTGIGKHYEVILDALAEVGIPPGDLSCIVATHVHLDHAGGAGYLAAECPDAEVYVHEIGAPHLVDPSRLWEGTKAAVDDQIDYYAEPKPVPEGRVTELTDGDELDVGDRALDVHHAPGHAPHQVVLHDPVSEGVFAADAAGNYTPGLDRVLHQSPPPNFDLEGVIADVETLEELDPAALYFGHFGDRPTGDILEEYRVVSREWVEAVREARERFEDDGAVADHFAQQARTLGVWADRKARGEERMNVKGAIQYLDCRE